MKFELNDQQIQVIAAALGNAPYNQSAPVINELQKQINEQQLPPTPVENKEDTS